MNGEIDLKNLRRIDDSVQWLWVTDYYDAPLEGSVTINGNRYWAKMCDENELCEGWFRRYLVIDLDSGEWEHEDHRHELFQNYVGSHWDYIDGHLPDNVHELVKPPTEHHLFSDNYKQLPPRDDARGTVIGWFER